MNTKKPVSPHLQVYRLPLTAILSITHRITGAILSLGLVITVVLLFALSGGESSWLWAQNLFQNILGQIILFLFTLSINYHLCNGIRHLFWDAGYGFDLETAHTNNRLVIIVTIFLSVFQWLLAINL